MRKLIVILISLTLTNCDINVNVAGGAGGDSSSSTSNPTSPTPTPTPSPNPSGGFRTPDPAPGQVLPLPTYGQTVVQSVTVPIGSPCLEFNFLDAVIDQLRARDTRWGYVCGSDCVNARRDKIAYHAVAGPEFSGALGVWIIDIISNACSPAQDKAYLVIGFDANIGWTSRGRF